LSRRTWAWPNSAGTCIHVTFVIVTNVDEIFISLCSTREGLETNVEGPTVSSHTATTASWSPRISNAALTPEAVAPPVTNPHDNRNSETGIGPNPDNRPARMQEDHHRFRTEGLQVSRMLTAAPHPAQADGHGEILTREVSSFFH